MKRMRMLIKKSAVLVSLALIVLLVSCSQKPPRNVHDTCDIFKHKSGWYKAAAKSQRKWGVPIAIQLAIIYQESRFKHNAKTPRRKLLWVIPWFRQSSAYGFGQAKTATWKWYKRARGRRFARRTRFKDVVDFIGWYCYQSYRRSNISRHDAYRLYLAYHEGHGGYNRRTYRRKRWLMATARKVERRARMYQAQLNRCERKFKRRFWFWPF